MTIGKKIQKWHSYLGFELCDILFKSTPDGIYGLVNDNLENTKDILILSSIESEGDTPTNHIVQHKQPLDEEIGGVLYHNENKHEEEGINHTQN